MNNRYWTENPSPSLNQAAKYVLQLPSDPTWRDTVNKATRFLFSHSSKALSTFIDCCLSAKGDGNATGVVSAGCPHPHSLFLFLCSYKTQQPIRAISPTDRTCWIRIRTVNQSPTPPKLGLSILTDKFRQPTMDLVYTGTNMNISLSCCFLVSLNETLIHMLTYLPLTRYFCMRRQRLVFLASRWRYSPHHGYIITIEE